MQTKLPTDKDNIFKHPLCIYAIILKKFHGVKAQLLISKLRNPNHKPKGIHSTVLHSVTRAV